MHKDEFELSEALLKTLLNSQFPQWANLTLRPLTSPGTDNAIYRLGNELLLRLPRISSAAKASAQLKKFKAT